MKNKLFSFSLSALVLLAMVDLKIFAGDLLLKDNNRTNKKAAAKAFQLPSGIFLEGKLQGPDADCLADAIVTKNIKGSGGLVRMCMTFANETDENLPVHLPAGLTFISEATGKESGVLLQQVELEVDANSTLQILLYAYSMDSEHDYTVGIHDVYELGPVTQQPAIVEISKMIEDLEIDENRGTTQEESDRLMYIGITLQDAVFAVLTHGELSAEDSEAIKNLK